MSYQAFPHISTSSNKYMGRVREYIGQELRNPQASQLVPELEKVKFVVAIKTSIVKALLYVSTVD